MYLYKQSPWNGNLVVATPEIILLFQHYFLIRKCNNSIVINSTYGQSAVTRITVWCRLQMCFELLKYNKARSQSVTSWLTRIIRNIVLIAIAKCDINIVFFFHNRKKSGSRINTSLWICIITTCVYTIFRKPWTADNCSTKKKKIKNISTVNIVLRIMTVFARSTIGMFLNPPKSIVWKSEIFVERRCRRNPGFIDSETRH